MARHLLDGFAFVGRNGLFASLVGLTPVNGVFGMTYITLLPVHMSPSIVVTTFILTVAMCLFAGALAVRRVLTADPADVF